MSERSILRIRTRPHSHPDRKEEWVVEVWRNAEVVASIYGSLEGIQIHSERFGFDPVVNQPFGVKVNGSPAIIVPLLAAGEQCPWCGGGGPAAGGPCPVCLFSKGGA